MRLHNWLRKYTPILSRCSCFENIKDSAFRFDSMGLKCYNSSKFGCKSGLEGMLLHHFKHTWQWTILVWIILGLFVFPLTPPISHHYSTDTDILVLSNTTHVLTVQAHPPTRETIQAHEDKILRHEDYDKEYEMTVFVVFITFILSKIWKKLKSILLAFLKFTSGYTGLIPSFFIRTQLNEMRKRGTLHVKLIGWS